MRTEEIIAKIEKMDKEMSLTLHKSGIDSTFALLVNGYRRMLVSKRKELTELYFEFSNALKSASSKEEVDKIYSKYKVVLESMR